MPRVIAIKVVKKFYLTQKFVFWPCYFLLYGFEKCFFTHFLLNSYKKFTQKELSML
ncbi:CAAX protease [Enterococcus casseliflavus]|uniref:Uncharacterized protein n=1 Tax=Enterococcus casseliflavus ATCC 12755 TaxID=888066 RepID=F0EMT2_ENTCA|nr:hypothetical protein HMPREF9087_2556 [Enterococcus casseliflavus ATCC 12755]EPH92143.1 hypothetical protein D922_02557 [Enterococcus faecalis 06-MB-DW-09]MBO1097011.1 CAAX protease [Enterococcus casseliflavus]MBO1121733.1 CAAX protease [Enterococcus casseliflavus]MBO1145333.1 CAAX protease [Enterococcus casseliflavus]